MATPLRAATKATKARALAAGIMVLCVIMIASTDVRADGRTEFLIARLSSDDFRVRTNAALALGATNDEAAVEPLCGALTDSSEVVRQAVAVAMKRLLKPSSLTCLKDRLTSESVDAVKLQITRAVEAIEAAGGGGTPTAPANVANAKFYVAISPITNNTGRPQADIDAQVIPAIQAKLASIGGFQLAPPNETPTAARAVMSKRKLKGYYLSVSVDKFDYSDGNLRVRVKVAVFDYPGKNLRGEVPSGMTQTGARSGDTSSENNLMGMTAARAVELFAQNFQ